MAHKCPLKTFHELTLEIRSDKKSETSTVEIGGVATQELSTNTLDLVARYSPAVYFVYSARGISLQPKGRSPAASGDQANIYTSRGIFS